MGIHSQGQGHQSYGSRNTYKEDPESYTKREREAIEKKNKQRRLAQQAKEAEAEKYNKLAQDERAEVAEQQQANMKKDTTTAPAEKSNTSRLASIFGTAGAATGNPYLVGASLAAGVIGKSIDRKREVEKYNMEQQQKRIARVMDAMGRLGAGVGQIGMA